MKKLLLFSLVFFFYFNGISQPCGTVVSHGILPSAPTDNAPSWLNLRVYCNEMIWLDHYAVNQAGNTFMVDAYYCYGWLQSITTTNDSIPFDTLPAGNYNYMTNIYLSYAPATNCMSYTAGSQVTGNFTVTGTTGIEKNTSETISVFPNPFSEIITITSATTFAGNDFVLLTDMNGKKVYQDLLPLHADSYSFSTSAIAPGIYFLQTTIAGRTSWYKMVK